MAALVAAAILPSNDGVRLPRGVFAAPRTHASRGGKPYPQEIREQVIAIWQNGNQSMDALDTNDLRQLRLQRKFPHLDTCRRWVNQFLSKGHVRPKRATGNKRAEREVEGEDLFQLSLYRLVRPKATHDEVRAYICNRNGQEPYSKSQIHRAEERLGLTTKVGSTTSDQAYRPHVLARRHNYWQRNYPLGVNDQNTYSMIDIDEAKFKLESQNRGRGKAKRHRRVDTRGKYVKGSPGVSLIMGISGDEQDPFEFHQMFSHGGTDTWRFYCFMREFIDWLDTNRPGETFCFTLDNLNIHKQPVILDLIEFAGHRVVFRAPYWSCDGAIEYVFNTIHTMLEMSDTEANNADELELVLDDIIFRMVPLSFRPYFVHVGFT